MRSVHLHDLLAGAVTLILVVAIVALALASRDVPAPLSTAFAAAIGYTFRGAQQAANDIRHNRRNTHDP